MNSRFNIFLCMILLLAACGQEQSSNDVGDVDAVIPSSGSSEQKGMEESTTMAAPVRDAEQDSVDHYMSNASPFLNEGCCLEETNREKSCCCESVFAQYQLMIQSNDSKVAELSMTDPILADCRRLMSKEFDALENPPSDESPEELF